jgi:hypothetical protein
VIRGVLALLLCLSIGACAVRPRQTAPLGPGEIVSTEAARNAISIGKSTKDDVRAALGQAVVVDFASGYEVWVYRERERPSELVLLFAPSGVLAKARIGNSGSGS